MNGFWRSFCSKRADSLVAKGKKSDALKWYRAAGDLERLGDVLLELGDAPSSLEAYRDAGNDLKSGQAYCQHIKMQ